MSKLISLVLVLAIAGVASAADMYWNSDVSSGAWNVASNWKLGNVATSPVSTQAPQTNDQAWIRPSLNGSITAGPITINVTSTDAVTARLNMNYGTFTMNVQTGAVLTNSGTIAATGWQFYNATGAGGVVNIDGSLLNERPDTTAMAVKIGGSGSGSSQTININNGGIMTVKNTQTHNAVFGIGNTGTGAGSARVNINSGGLLDVDGYTFGALVNKKMQIGTGGLMKVRGNVSAQIAADILAGNIVGKFGTSECLGVWQDGGYTYVPEPATIALLGLGSLTLLRRKR